MPRREYSDKIQEVIRYEVDGICFRTQSAAQESLESRVAEYVRNLFIKQGLPMSQAVKFTEQILAERKYLAHILDF